VRAGESLGILEIRVGPQERLDLEAKLKEAGLRNQGAIEIERVQRDRVERLRSLTTSDIVSRREMADALVALSEAETQLATTRAAVQLWTTAILQISERKENTSRWRMPLAASADGEITQVLVRPGMSVEAGAPLVRIVNFQHLLVRLDVPPELLAGPPPTQVRLQSGNQGHTELSPSHAFGRGDPRAAASEPKSSDSKVNEPKNSNPSESDQPGIDGRLVGMAPQVDVVSQLTSYWYEANAASTTVQTWRPGLFVKALVTPPGAKSRPAVAVPRTAVVWHEGQPWVYVQVATGQFARRSVQLLDRAGADYLLGSGVEVGEVVVSRQTQVLLSEEFRTAGDDD
jgi:hypothetical protein